MLPARSNVNPSEPPVFAATSAGDDRVVATDAGANPSKVESPGALPTPSHSLPLVGISAYETLTTVVAPALTQTAGRSTVPSNTWLVMAVWGAVTRAAVTSWTPAGSMMVEVVWTTPAWPSTVTAPGS